MTRERLSMHQYLRFFLVGATVGILAILLREIVARMLPADSPLYYSLSVIAVYAIATFLSFALHRRYTFRLKPSPNPGRQMMLFVAVVLAGAASTWLLSLVLRYGLTFDMYFGDLAGAAAFALATLLSSLMTYAANGRYVFTEAAHESKENDDK